MAGVVNVRSAYGRMQKFGANFAVRPIGAVGAVIAGSGGVRTAVREVSRRGDNDSLQHDAEPRYRQYPCSHFPIYFFALGKARAAAGSIRRRAAGSAKSRLTAMIPSQTGIIPK